MKISGFRLVDAFDADYDLVVNQFNNTSAEYPRSVSIPDLFDEIVSRYEEKCAIIHNHEQISYGELMAESNRIAAFLREKGVGPEEPVALLFENSIASVTSVLGILKAGCCYVPLNVDFPDIRLLHILEETEACVLITSRKFADRVGAISHSTTFLKHVLVFSDPVTGQDGLAALPTGPVPDFVPADKLRGYSSVSAHPKMHSGNLAYIAYTSGSTGKPKGVLIEHRSVVRLVRNSNFLTMQAEDVMSHVFPLSFDPSALEIYGALLNGASLVIVDKHVLLTPSLYHRLLCEHSVSVGVMTASVFNKVVDYSPIFDGRLRQLIVGGEVISPQHVNKVRMANGERFELTNAYGPTENAVVSTYYSITEPHHGAIPIGRPISNTQCYILKESGELLPVGVVGELCVSGDGLARGYFKDERLTQERFIVSPFDKNERLYRTGDFARWLPSGDIEFAGRKDDQVKIRGYRVELEDVANHLRALSNVKEAIVLDSRTETGETFLVGYVTMNSAEGIRSDALEIQLSARVPKYMVPAVILEVPEFPLTPHGKVDKAKLPKPELNRNHATDGYVAPNDSLEVTLVEIFESVLNNRPIGVTHNFFKLGGHSLNATQVWLKINERLNVSIDLRTIFSSPTVRDLAEIIRLKEQTYSRIPVVNTDDRYYPMSQAQKRLWVSDQFQSGSAYTIFKLFEFQELLDNDVLAKVLRCLSERHESLRTIFFEVNNEPVQFVQSVEDCNLAPEYSFINGADSAERVNAIANEEARRAFDLKNGPLIRVKLVRVNETRDILMVAMHHIIADGWSMEILISEFLKLYGAFLLNAENPLPPLKIQYKDFTAWQNQRITGVDEVYWMQKLTPLPEPLKLPYQQKVQNTDMFEGASRFFEIDKALSDKLRKLAQQYDTTLSNTFLSVYALLLYKITSQDDIIIGIGHANRNHADVQQVIGYFVNILPIRIEFDDTFSFGQLIEHVSATCLDAYEHSNYPFDRIIEKLSVRRNGMRQSLVNVFYSYLNFQKSEIGPRTGFIEEAEEDDPSEEITGHTIIQRSDTKFDLTFYVNDENSDGMIRFHFEYNSQVFHPATIEIFVATVLATLHSLTEKELKL